MKRKASWAAAAAAIALGAGGLVWWLAQPGGADGLRLTGSSSAGLATAAPFGQSAAADAASALARQRGANTGSDSFLTSELRYKFEEMILEAGEAGDPATLKQRLAALVARHFAPGDVARATALIERYVDYRVALGQLKTPADPGDPRALRAALDARQQVRARHFTAEEYDALFAQEAELDRFTVARIEIERNAGLTPAQKQAALRDAERELGVAQRAVRADAVAHVAVAAQTAAFDASGASEQERHAQRRAQYGDAAAQQLAQMDREEKDWQSRLSEYAAAQARSPGVSQLQQLRDQLFSAQEQLRIEGALAVRQMAAPTASKP